MGKLKTSVRLFGGVPTIHVNGVPVTGLMHWNRNMQAEDVRLFAESGIRFFSFIGNLDLGDGTSTDDGIRTGFRTMTAEFINVTIDAILKECPEALVIPRFRLQASDAWKSRHPGSLMRYYNLEKHVFEDGDMVSLGNDIWITDALEALRNSVRFCERQWGEHIPGYHSDSATARNTSGTGEPKSRITIRQCCRTSGTGWQTAIKQIPPSATHGMIRL